jgi:hypothetical protein
VGRLQSCQSNFKYLALSGHSGAAPQIINQHATFNVHKQLELSAERSMNLTGTPHPPPNNM